MNLLVLGASNEIMKNGYISSMHEGNGIVNLSIGGCGSTAGVYSLLNYSQKIVADFCILSFELNEHGILGSGLRNQDEVRNNFRWIISRLAQNNCLPLMVVLPRLENGKIARTGTCDLHSDIARNHNIPFVDVAEWFLRLERSGVSPNFLMRDDAHISDVAAHYLGKALLEYIYFLRNFDFYFVLKKSSGNGFGLFNAMCLAPSLKTVFRKTSLNSSNLAVFMEGDCVRLKSDHGSRLYGVIANRYAWPGASMSVGLTRKNLWYPGAKEGAYLKTVIDLKGVFSHDGGFDICFHKNTKSPTERTWLSRVSLIEDCGPPLAEVESFLVEFPGADLGGEYAIFDGKHEDFVDTSISDFWGEKIIYSCFKVS